ncbi:MAG: SIS domain-containing protein, partial [Rhodospirillales bacterium]|nr:SIS domain-containing protein [Rhodospirillales bacterium]
AATLDDAYARHAGVFACGNGGSASISNHLVCDHLKGVQTDTEVRPHVHSLATNMELLTAIANDLSYDDVFVYQLRTLAKAGDVLITISSSGDSENVVRAATWAQGNGLKVIAFTGFDGGRTAGLATAHLHVAGDNYGVIEDAHQSVMHVLAQYLRQARMNEGRIAQRKF